VVPDAIEIIRTRWISKSVCRQSGAINNSIVPIAACIISISVERIVGDKARVEVRTGLGGKCEKQYGEGENADHRNITLLSSQVEQQQGERVQGSFAPPQARSACHEGKLRVKKSQLRRALACACGSIHDSSAPFCPNKRQKANAGERICEKK
jgi:ribosomal protein L40E